LTIGENRLELLAVEVQEGRVLRQHTVLRSLGLAACGFLAAVAFTGAILDFLWEGSPVAVLLT
jgi:hypothetical protein